MDNKPEVVEDKKLKEVSQQIEKILVDNKMGFQPILAVSQFGIFPRVNIAHIEDKKKDE